MGMDADVALLQEATPRPEDAMRLSEASQPPSEGVATFNLGN